jgi:hypothetical protein
VTEAKQGISPASATGAPSLPDGLAKCLADEPILGAFRRLPLKDQRNFIRWVSASESTDERLRRALILRDALRGSPLAWETRADLPNRRPG